MVLNEVNTLPGLTSYSRYPRMMAAAGLPLAEVIDRLVSLALRGSADERRVRLRRRARARHPLGRQVRDLGQLHRQARGRLPGQPHRRHARRCARPWSGRRKRPRPLGFGLLLWDGYRPQRAVDCFLRWSQQPEDGRTKPRHYPNIDRAEMFAQGYVAARSGHSRGSTVDLTLYHLATGELAAMGGDHDLMDPVSHHGAPGIRRSRRGTASTSARSWRAAGFDRYDCEWWHYTLQGRAASRHLLRLSRSPNGVGRGNWQLHRDAEPAVRARA